MYHCLWSPIILFWFNHTSISEWSLLHPFKNNTEAGAHDAELKHSGGIFRYWNILLLQLTHTWILEAGPVPQHSEGLVWCWQPLQLLSHRQSWVVILCEGVREPSKWWCFSSVPKFLSQMVPNCSHRRLCERIQLGVFCWWRVSCCWQWLWQIEYEGCSYRAEKQLHICFLRIWSW